MFWASNMTSKSSSCPDTWSCPLLRVTEDKMVVRATFIRRMTHQEPEGELCPCVCNFPSRPDVCEVVIRGQKTRSKSDRSICLGSKPVFRVRQSITWRNTSTIHKACSHAVGMPRPFSKHITAENRRWDP